jgi:chromosome partitioning protein
VSKIIGIIQVKGGAGRSTIATNLAGFLATKGSTALVDCDLPQGTSAAWGALRQANHPDGLTIATASNHVELVKQVEILGASHDYLVLDGPPRIAEMVRAALIVSDISLIPIGASAAEIWATADLLETIHEAKAVKPDVDARIVWTRFRGHTREAQELSQAATIELGLRELHSRLGFRVAYSEALGRGLTVMEGSERTARVEFQALGREILEMIGRK